jgi:hypothetical protein
VINAAIPSYSLFQAVARFEYEILGKFKIDTVYLQVHDPVATFLRLGAQWRPDTDVATTPTLKASTGRIASVVIVRNALRHFGALKEFESDKAYHQSFNSADQRSLDFYRREIRSELEHLHSLIVQANARQLVVAPATVPTGPYQRQSTGYHVALEALNDELRQFADRYNDTVFFDTIGVLNRYPETEVFVDYNHLTERGNDVVAINLLKLITQTQVLLYFAH